MKPTKYAVEFEHPRTGHRVQVFVDLTAGQRADVSRKRGGPDHPLALRHALDNAAQHAPAGYVWASSSDICPLVVH